MLNRQHRDREEEQVLRAPVRQSAAKVMYADIGRQDPAPLERTALADFMDLTIFAADENESGKTVTGRDLLTAASQLEITQGKFTLVQLEELLPAPYAAAVRNLVSALDHCVNNGILIRECSLDPARRHAAYEIADRQLTDQLLEGFNITPEPSAIDFANLKITEAIISIDPDCRLKFKDISVLDYFKIRTCGVPIRDVLTSEHLLDCDTQAYGPDIYLFEQLEKRAAEMMLIKITEEYPPKVILNEYLLQPASLA